MRKRFAIMKDVSFLTQRIDHLVKLLLKLVGLEVFSEISPGAEEPGSVRVHVSPKIPDQACLLRNLRTLAEGVLIFCLDHGSLF